MLYKPDTTEPVSEKPFAGAVERMSRNEIIVTVVLLGALILWITEPIHHISSVLVGMMAFVTLTATGVIRKEHFARLPWGMLTFIGGLLSIASMMKTFRISDWVATIIAPLMKPFTGNILIFITFICALEYLLRYVIISQSTAYSVCILALLPAAEIVGMAPVVLAFIVAGASGVWNLSFHNTAFLSAMASGGSDLVEHKNALPLSYAYMLIHILACYASVPLWSALGLIA